MTTTTVFYALFTTLPAHNDTWFTITRSSSIHLIMWREMASSSLLPSSHLLAGEVKWCHKLTEPLKILVSGHITTNQAKLQYQHPLGSAHHHKLVVSSNWMSKDCQHNEAMVWHHTYQLQCGVEPLTRCTDNSLRHSANDNAVILLNTWHWKYSQTQ